MMTTGKPIAAISEGGAQVECQAQHLPEDVVQDAPLADRQTGVLRVHVPALGQQKPKVLRDSIVEPFETTQLTLGVQ